ncbi:hypothetical protein [Clostridium manihotivorum]|uniref:DUF3784 domain-containing protein n=1 Tax=Clostridium manihotivorum TaxID=2320868 RepID=A0A410DSY7_9CLOT|nr:hypothetical protein [Clostridium manihotivorum]QAA32199.1 hypothetical protein C1I91_11410 [Clostridium manihotivorum]
MDLQLILGISSILISIVLTLSILISKKDHYDIFQVNIEKYEIINRPKYRFKLFITNILFGILGVIIGFIIIFNFSKYPGYIAISYFLITKLLEMWTKQGTVKRKMIK